jgi:pimeloyl-ACP methyl ester carboxylesterase
MSGNSELSRGLARSLRYLLAAECGFIAVALLTGLVYQILSASRERRLYHPPGRLINLGGYRLHLYCLGEGSPTVVLDFGLDGSYLDWSSVQPKAASSTRVCSYDRGGYGWSDPSPKPRVPSAMVEELQALLTAAGEKPPYILVGHSFGAFNALMFAHKYRAEVAGLVLVDGSHPDSGSRFPRSKRLWLRMMQFSMVVGLPRWRKWCGIGPPEIAGVKTALECRPQVYRSNYSQFAALAQSHTEIRQLPPLGDLPLVVVSRDPHRSPAPADPVIPSIEQSWQRLQSQLLEFSTNSVQLVAEGSGHNIPRARPDVVIEGIRRILHAGQRSLAESSSQAK